MTTAHPELGTVTVLTHSENATPARRALQEAAKARKKYARGKGVAQLVREAAQMAEAWTRDNDELLHDLMSDVKVNKVALAGDWHGSTLAAGAAFHEARRAGADVLVQLGDLGVWPGHEGQEYLDTLEYLADKYMLPLLFIDGNHEDFPQLNAAHRHETGVGVLRPNVLHLRRGTVWTWAGYRFGALGGAPSIDKGTRLPGVSWWPEEVVTEADVTSLLENTGDEPLDVLLTHDTVSDAPLPTRRFPLPGAVQMECDISRQQLSRVTAQVTPQLLVHGHYHEHKEYPSAYTQVLGLDMEMRRGALALLTLNT